MLSIPMVGSILTSFLVNLGRIDGEKWSDLRKAMNQPMMSPKAAQTYIPHLGRVMDECSLHLAANGHDMGDYLPRVTFEMSV